MLEDGEKGVILQRDRETYAVAPHIPCGLVTPAILRRLADVAERHGVAALKITSAARIALIGLREEQVDAVWADLAMDPGHAVGLCVRSVKACPGTTFCKRGKQDSLGLGLRLDERFQGRALPGKLKLGVSGCVNQCAETCIKDIGAVGTPRGWTVFVGGNGGARPRLARELARDLDADRVLELVERIMAFFQEHGVPRRRLGDALDRVGFDAFRCIVLPGEGPAPAAPAE